MALDASFFVTDTIHEKKVKLGDGSEHTLHFKELPAVVFNKYLNGLRSDDEDVRAAAAIPVIVASLVNADGSQALTVEEAARLKPGPLFAITNAITEINEPKKVE